MGRLKWLGAATTFPSTSPAGLPVCGWTSVLWLSRKLDDTRGVAYGCLDDLP
ncbi:MAG TPA: hypothetical protein PLJ27_04395 [Polyangiaceae bacterium]|nr:hypothetical protein [Polyangiaceae bacterium]HPY18384.1 hypothetical protein [Polyangiaceae bacterium]HQF24944.1 hypothetical protein [Polyangiaceae bacterium]HQK16671.1 hypothetical protein [Polyangiaceae bacterium]HQM09146.1 hypothetical protein [Polyangiaceae bacterium]